MIPNNPVQTCERLVGSDVIPDPSEDGDMVCMCSKLVFDLPHTIVPDKSNAQHNALNVRDIKQFPHHIGMCSGRKPL